MDSKMYRYMQRLQRLMTPTKSKSPHRPSKSPLTCKTNQLDQYLKYELAAKIINTLTIRNNNRLVAVFFNSLRNCDYQQKELIYKFVSVEKKDRGMNVDISIAVKLFVASLNGIVRKQIDGFMEVLKEGGEGRKENKRQTDIMTKLVRTSSRTDKRNYVEVKEWTEDAQTLNERQKLVKQVKTLRSYAGKVLTKLINAKRKKELKKALKSIKIYSFSQKSRKIEQQINQITNKIIAEEQAKKQQLYTCKIKQNDYISEIDSLNAKMMKNTGKTMTLSASTGQVIPTVTHEEEESLDWIKDNDEIRAIGERLFAKRKGILLKELRIIGKRISIQRNDGVQASRMGKGLLLMDKFIQKYKNLGYKAIKRQDNFHKTQKKLNGHKLLFCISSIYQKRRIQLFHFFFKKINISRKATVQPASNGLQLALPTTIVQKDHLRLTSRTTDRQKNSDLKNDFEIFVQKMGRMMVLITKISKNMAEAFVRIDKFAASLPDNLINSSPSLPRKRSSPTAPPTKQSLLAPNSLQKIFQKCQILESTLKTHINPLYIQAFSYIKIISKDRQPKIKILPLKSSIVTQTQQFISQRNHEFDKSFITWKRLQLQLENPNVTGDLERQILQARKRRISTH